MKEDLAEWLSTLYPTDLSDIDAECFLDRLENGEHLVTVGRGNKRHVPYFQFENLNFERRAKSL